MAPTRCASRSPFGRALRIGTLLLATAGAARAQTLPVGTTATSVAVTGLAQLGTRLDGGASFAWNGGLASASVMHQFSPQFGAGLSLRYEYQEWSFTDLSPGAGAPWTGLRFGQVGIPLTFQPSPVWSFMLAPSVGSAYESGAAAGDAVTYGAVMLASKAFSRTFVIGLGAAVYRQIYTTHVYPFPVIYWQIDARWKVTNPFQAGPAGGAGVEVTYKLTDHWDIGAGGSYRSFLFRLAPTNPSPDGIGRDAFFLGFGRLSYALGARTRLDLYGAALVAGSLIVKNESGGDLRTEGYSTAPAIGLTFQTSF